MITQKDVHNNIVANASDWQKSYLSFQCGGNVEKMELVKEQGGRCSARFKFNCTNKITRMENARDNIIRDYYFRDFKKMDRKSQYYKFMKELTTMTRSGKVTHDDAPDSISLFENEMRTGVVAKAEAAINPFRRM